MTKTSEQIVTACFEVLHGLQAIADLACHEERAEDPSYRLGKLVGVLARGLAEGCSDLQDYTVPETHILPRVLDQIEAALRHILAPIPAKPTTVQSVTVEPHIMTPEEARRAPAPSPAGGE